MTWLILFALLVTPPAGCKRQALEQGQGTVLVCQAGVL